MIDLTLAQGAEHTKPENLKRIVDTINKERITFLGNKDVNVPQANLKLAREYADKILSEYLCGGDMSVPIEVSPLSYAVEEKYDGYSYLNVEGRFFSKSLSNAAGSKGMPVEKTDRVLHLAEILKKVYEQCGADLHGELYKMGGISDDVTRIMGCNADEANRRQAQAYEKEGASGPLHYMLIDIRAIYGMKLINEPHRLRRAILKWVYYKYIKPLDIHGFIQLTEELTGDPNEEFRRIVLAGGEGIIIKREDALYIPGKKPANNWIKGKKKITHDVFMLGLNAGTGKNAGLFGSIRFGHMVDGKVVECGSCSSGLADDMRAYIYNNADKLITNKQVFEIEAIQESVKSFRNAVFLRLRDDKGWQECTPVGIRVKESLI